mmetsp:Transcript_87099/g.281227  ORF Transcript_87099/g.281227 Transcript_87099/m.281227 type:complete len:260 (+) Transcript_87099:947-1726(+)
MERGLLLRQLLDLGRGLGGRPLQLLAAGLQSLHALCLVPPLPEFFLGPLQACGELLLLGLPLCGLVPQLPELGHVLGVKAHHDLVVQALPLVARGLQLQALPLPVLFLLAEDLQLACARLRLRLLRLPLLPQGLEFGLRGVDLRREAPVLVLQEAQLAELGNGTLLILHLGLQLQHLALLAVQPSLQLRNLAAQAPSLPVEASPLGLELLPALFVLLPHPRQVRVQAEQLQRLDDATLALQGQGQQVLLVLLRLQGQDL